MTDALEKTTHLKSGIDQIFFAALRATFDSLQHGSRFTMAKKINVSAGQFNRICAGISSTTEDIRRDIARNLGYDYYESFLNIGRKALDLPVVKHPDALIAAEQTSDRLEKVTQDAHEQELAYLRQIQNLSKLLCELQEENRELKTRLSRYELDA